MVYSYFTYLFITLFCYFLYKLLKKDHFKIDDIKNVIFILVIVTYTFILFYKRSKFLFHMSYIKSLIIIFSLCFLLFTFGLIKNDEKTYKKNMNIYFILSLLVIFSITIVIGRPDIKINGTFYIGNYEPFHSIKLYLKYSALETKIYNLVGNSVLLIPISFALMMKDKKYNNVFRQSLILLPTIIGIEVLQAFTQTGAFDVDDIILNYFGAIIFTFIITRFNLVDIILKLFYRDFNLNVKIKYLLFFISLIIPTIFVVNSIKILFSLNI